jgi:LPXTG-motif cell wall-anchored protein
MTAARCCALALSAASLALPAAAGAQGVTPSSSDLTTTAPRLSQTPPAAPRDGTGSSSSHSAVPTPVRASPRLPATGAEPGLVALVGAGMLLAGLGLRLRLGGA